MSRKNSKPTNFASSPKLTNIAAAAKRTPTPTSQNGASSVAKTKNETRKAERETTTPKYQQVRIVENFIVVWLDANIYESNEELTKTVSHIQNIVYKVLPFDDLKKCIDYLTGITMEKVFLIVSGSLGQPTMEHVERMDQVDSIYIYCGNRSRHEQWTKDFKKVKGVFTEIKPICDALRRDVRQLDNDLTPMSIFTLPSDSDWNEQNQSFIYSQRIKKFILELDDNIQTMDELVEFCRVQYSDNGDQLKIITEFSQEYDQHSPIWWYTRGCFIYSMLNRALRMQDTDIIMKMGFIIRGLLQDIEQSFEQSKNQGTMTVYRGQCMSKEEFEKLKKMRNGYIAFNSFLLTSIVPEHYSGFTGKARDDPDATGVLFQMKIDLSTSSTSFVKLNGISFNQDWENEVLFSMGTTFQIVGIKQRDEQLWQVDLTLINKNDKLMRSVTENISKKVKGTKELYELGDLIREKGDLDATEKSCGPSTNTTSNVDFEERAKKCYELGHRYWQNGDYETAIQYYDECLNILSTHLPSDDHALEEIHCNMGITFLDKGDFSKALNHFQAALVIHRKHNPDDDPSLATCYKNIGAVHLAKTDYQAALPYYQAVLDIQKSSPQSSSNLAATHSNLALVLENTQRPSEAIEHATKAVEIARSLFGPKTPQFRVYKEQLDKLSHTNGDKRSRKK